MILRASKLNNAAASFRLRQSSADEALALVQRAMQLFAQQGPSALPTITQDGAIWTDRDMYVFVFAFAFDTESTYRVIGGNAAEVGSNLRNLRNLRKVRGVNAAKLMAGAFERAGRSGGWVDDEIIDPQTGTVDLKTSCVHLVARGLLVGCGVHEQRDDAKVPAAAHPTGRTPTSTGRIPDASAQPAT